MAVLCSGRTRTKGSSTILIVLGKQEGRVYVKGVSVLRGHPKSSHIV